MISMWHLKACLTVGCLAQKTSAASAPQKALCLARLACKELRGSRSNPGGGGGMLSSHFSEPCKYYSAADMVFS